VILNADGVYLACYYTLHLNLRLAMVEFYSSSSSSAAACPPVTKHDFIGSVLGSGLLVFVSPTWLSEVYDVVSEVDAFGFCALMGRLGGLRGALSDLDGLGRTDVGAQMTGHERRAEAGKGWQIKAEDAGGLSWHCN
jgi:brefeldin A-inhibited guanine nucleotide-exchange protein 3